MADVGIGKHKSTLPIEAQVNAFKYVYVVEQTYIAGTTTLKLAFGCTSPTNLPSLVADKRLVFYLRILSQPWVYHASAKFARRASRIIYGLMILAVLFAIGFGMVFVFQCSPISHMWTQFAGSKGSCINSKVILVGTYGHSAINAILDLMLAVLPIPIIWKVQLDWRAKVSVLLILGVGCM